MQCLSTPDESELPSQAVTVFAWSTRKHAVLCYPDGRLCTFCWLFPDTFCSVLPFIAVFFRINWFFQKEFIVEDCFPVPPHTQNHLFGWRSVFGVVGVVVHFSCPMISSIPHYCTVYTFHCPSSSVFKMKHFCYMSVENCVWKNKVKKIFLLNLCGSKTSKRLTQPRWCKWFSRLDLDILSISAISHMVYSELFSVNVSTGAFLVVEMVKNLPVMQETQVWCQSQEEWNSLPGEGNCYPLQYFCLDNSMDRGAWWAIVHRVPKS